MSSAQILCTSSAQYMLDRAMATSTTSACSVIERNQPLPGGTGFSAVTPPFSVSRCAWSSPGAGHCARAGKSAVSQREEAPALMELMVQWTIICKRQQERRFPPSSWIPRVQAHPLAVCSLDVRCIPATHRTSLSPSACCVQPHAGDTGGAQRHMGTCKRHRGSVMKRLRMQRRRLNP